MNKTTLSNPVRPIAFFLTAIILACTFGFTVDGWQMIDEPAKEDTLPSDETPPENTDIPDISTEEEAPAEPEIYIPEHTSRLTGLEISEDKSRAMMLAFVMSSDLPTYGLSSAEVVCEIPIENGGTRLIAFIPEYENLWKIGSITNTRGYISNIAKYLGAALVSSGDDDSIEYTKCDISGAHLDFSKAQGYHYTEYTSNIYTNRDLLISGLEGSEINVGKINNPPLPFILTDFGQDKIYFTDAIANSVIIRQSADAKTELRFNEEKGSYSLLVNGTKKLDALNGEGLNYENCFVLFADSVTYDNSKCNQMVMDTIGEGVGFYFTNGSYSEITWTATSGGIMTFYSKSGEKLTVNRGRSYISYVRSSCAGEISIE